MQETLNLPDSDDCLYRLLTLDNKLEVLLIHDGDAEKAGAALDVGVGSLCDTEHMPGVAHAVEHLLSMGTLKYPEENAYDEYLSKFGGSSNAFTSMNSTNFYFEITYPFRSDRETSGADSSPLWGALDRFGEMFVSPTFSEDSVRREMESIDSEFKESMQDDAQRLYQLNKSLANPEHPYSRFAFGNLRTLYHDIVAQGLAPRDECQKFFSTHYASSRMKLVVLGREPLEILQQWVEKIFSAIPEKCMSRNCWQVPVYTSSHLLTQTFVRPVHELRLIQIQFPYLDEEDMLESHPSWYLTHLLSHKGPGSLFALLRHRGWANKVSANTYTACPGSGLFHLDLEMTVAGSSRYQDIVVFVFQYVAMLQKTRPQQWVVEELIHMSNIKFHFRGKSPLSHTVSKLANTLQSPYRGSSLLSGQVTIQKFDPHLIEKAISFLRPDNFRLTMVNLDDAVAWDLKEPWYGTEYRHERIPADFLVAVQEAFHPLQKSTDFHFPPRNKFLPSMQDLQSLSVVPYTERPILIRHTQRVRTWWHVSRDFHAPRPIVHVYFRTPLTSINARSRLIASLYVQLVQDALVVLLHDAIASGSEYDLCCHEGLEVEVSSYRDKLHELLEQMLKLMRSFVVDCERFQIVRERMITNIRNWDLKQPWEQIGTYSDYFKDAKSFVFEDTVQILESITPDEVKTFYPYLFEQCMIELFVHGNISRDDTSQLADMVERVIAPTGLAKGQYDSPQSVVLAPGSDIVYEQKLIDPGNDNNCVEYSLYVGHCYDRMMRAKLQLLSQLIEEPCFHHLRTTEQLGYVVRSGHVFLRAWAGFSIILQGDHSCRYLESRISVFLKTLEATLREMSDVKFAAHREALGGKLLASYTNFSEADARLWSHIMNGSYDFMQGLRNPPWSYKRC
jgi:insulysin